MATKTQEKEFVYTVVLIDGSVFPGEPTSETKARSAAEEFIVKGFCSGVTYYPASQIKRIKVSEHV